MVCHAFLSPPPLNKLYILKLNFKQKWDKNWGAFGTSEGRHWEQTKNKKPFLPQKPRRKPSLPETSHWGMKFFIFQMVCHHFQTGLIPRLPNYKLGVFICTFLNCELSTTGTKTKVPDLGMSVSVTLMRYNGETVDSWSLRHEKGAKIKSACNYALGFQGFVAQRSWNSHHHDSWISHAYTAMEVLSALLFTSPSDKMRCLPIT
jgi:hypothetical protein